MLNLSFCLIIYVASSRPEVERTCLHDNGCFFFAHRIAFLSFLGPKSAADATNRAGTLSRRNSACWKTLGFPWQLCGDPLETCHSFHIKYITVLHRS